MPRITSLELRQKLFPYARPTDDAEDVRLPNVLDEGVSSTPFVSSASVDNDKNQKSAKVSADHIPRPVNCYILFQNDFRRNNSRDSSRVNGGEMVVQSAAAAWRRMSEQEKAPWRERAKIVGAEHKLKYPNYKFRPVHTKKRTKGNIKKNGNVQKDGEDPLQGAVQNTVQGEVQGTSEPSVQGQFNGVIQYTPVYFPNDLYQYQVAQNLALMGGQMGMGIPPSIPLPALPRWPGILHGELLQTNQLTSDPGLAPSWATTGLQYPRFDNFDDLPYFI